MNNGFAAIMMGCLTGLAPWACHSRSYERPVVETVAAAARCPAPITEVDAAPPRAEATLDAGSPTLGHSLDVVPTLELELGHARVLVTRTAAVPDWAYVDTITVGREIVYPIDCSRRDRLVPELCSKAHSDLRSGRGGALRLIDYLVEGARAELFFTAGTPNSPECGAYGVWLLRVDAKGIRATPPILGCIPAHRDGDAVGPQPPVMWGKPRRLDLIDASGRWATYTLKESPFGWRLALEGRTH